MRLLHYLEVRNFGVAWGLAVLDGLAAGALALATSICLRAGRFAGLIETGRDRRRDVGVVLACAIAAPARLHRVTPPPAGGGGRRGQGR